MNKIKILNQAEIEGGFKFVVDAGGAKFEVIVDNYYYQKIFNSKGSREEFVIFSFRFLLERESKESIFKKFNLQTVKKYFPEYEEVIKNQEDGKNI